MSEIKKIFITGGAGYVGAMLAPFLISKGYELTIYDLWWFWSVCLCGSETNFLKILALHCIQHALSTYFYTDILSVHILD